MTDGNHPTVNDQTGIPAILTRLGLSGDQLSALQRQGFLTVEDRGFAKPIYKLRFRLDGRQKVKVLGTDEHLVQQVREALEVLQRPRHAIRKLKQVEQRAQILVRETKRNAMPLLASQGLRFHGHVLRRTRV